MSVRLAEEENAELKSIWTQTLLDSGPERECEELVRLATTICGVSVGLVTLLDERQQWFRTTEAWKLNETPRESYFCTQTVQRGGLHVVGDSLADSSLASNPLIHGDPVLRFFAGVPLQTESGDLMGTLSVLDAVPHTLDANQIRTLEVLGKQVSARLELLEAR